MKNLICRAAFLTALLPLCSANNVHAQLYRVIDLGTLGGVNPFAGYPNTSVSAINNSGQVVGQSYVPGDTYFHAFLYSNGTMSDLGTFGGTYSAAYGINNSGQIVGDSNVTNSIDHAFLYSGGSLHDLGTLGGTMSVGTGINTGGQITGVAKNANGDGRAFLFDGSMINLGTLGGTVSQGTGINDSGQIVGYSFFDATFRTHAFQYSNGVMSDLGALNGNGGTSYGLAINQSGQVVGYSSTAPFGDFHAFSYLNGHMTDLGALPNLGWSFAFGVNKNGLIVGTSNHNNDPGGHAFLFKDGTMLDLNNLVDSSGAGWQLQQARAINDNGWIAGDGINPNGQVQSFLLIPVPEPSALALAAGGLLVLMAGMHRSRCQRRRSG